MKSYSGEEIHLEASTSTGIAYHSQSMQSIEDEIVNESLEQSNEIDKDLEAKIPLHQDEEQATDEPQFFDSDSMC